MKTSICTKLIFQISLNFNVCNANAVIYKPRNSIAKNSNLKPNI